MKRLVTIQLLLCLYVCVFLRACMWVCKVGPSEMSFLSDVYRNCPRCKHEQESKLVWYLIVWINAKRNNSLKRIEKEEREGESMWGNIGVTLYGTMYILKWLKWTSSSFSPNDAILKKIRMHQLYLSSVEWVGHAEKLFYDGGGGNSGKSNEWWTATVFFTCVKGIRN